MKLKERIFIVVLITALIGVFFSYKLVDSSAEKTIKQNYFEKLTAIRSTKKQQVESYFAHLREQVAVISQSPSVIAAASELSSTFSELSYVDKLIFDTSLTGNKKAEIKGQLVFENSQQETLYKLAVQNSLVSKKLIVYNDTYNQYDDFLKRYATKLDFYDILIADARSGEVIYSAKEETSLATSIISGADRHGKNYVPPNLDKAFSAGIKAKNPGSVRLVDFDFYLPSNDVPASFFSVPIYDGKTKVAVLMAQVSIEELDGAMTGNRNWKEEGLGDTGETYIVGDDLKMRNNSRFYIENPTKYVDDILKLGVSNSTAHDIKQKQTTVLYQKVDTSASNQALSGFSGITAHSNYRGKDVLASFSPLNIPDVNWAIISEISQIEAFTPISEFRQRTLYQVIILISVLTFVGLLSSRFVAKPLTTLSLALQKIRDTEFAKDLPAGEKDEINQLILHFNKVSAEFNDMKNKLNLDPGDKEKDICNQCITLASLRSEIATVVKRSSIDQLTGAYNRAKITEELENEIDALYELDDPSALIMFDLDNFKSVNDHNGHDKGDEILKEVSKIVKSHHREHDVFARWGGDEFLLLLPKTSLVQANAIANRLKNKVLESSLLNENNVTCSFGVTLLVPNQAADITFKNADTALYRAKNKGKNTVETFQGFQVVAG